MLVTITPTSAFFGSYGVLSPDIRYTSFWWVDISGAPDSYLHNDVSYSYGNFSPGTISNLVVWYILRDGMSNFDYTSFDGELIDYSLLYSYGSPMAAADIVTYGAWDVWTSGAVEFYNGYAFSSYGLYSPDTSDIQFVWMVFPSGFINHNLDYTISYSYGSALRARKIPMALGMSTLLAASSSTTTTVPTAVFMVVKIAAHGLG